jgi:hypothetical protein
LSKVIHKRSLKTSEICTIIEACSQAGVIELKFGDLHVRFAERARSDVTQSLPIIPEAEISDEQTQQIATDSLRQDELTLKSERLQQMIIDEPAEFERLLLDGDLIDEASHDLGTE